MSAPQTLPQLQATFQGALLQDQPLAYDVLSQRGVAQFGVYRNAYRARLHAALRDNYEVLPLVMGDDDFDTLAAAYIATHPSQHYSLRWYGHALCPFMANQADLVAHPAMVDLASMEWALRNAFDAADMPPLTATQLAAVPPSDWAQMVLALHPSVQLLEMQWAVGPVWHALKTGQEDVPVPDALVHSMLVWRQGVRTQWKTLTTPEIAFVQCLAQKKSFAAVCMALAQCVGEDNAAATAVQLLQGLLEAGAVCALETASPGSDA